MISRDSRKALMIPPDESMGARIKRLRTGLKMTQEDLAQACEVTKAAVSYWETGSTDNIKLQSFRKLVATLQCEFEYLIYGPVKSVREGDTQYRTARMARPKSAKAGAKIRP